jgi:hypothetical protein
MRVGQKIKIKGEMYEIKKIDFQGRCFAEDEFGINLICFPDLKIIK